MGWLKGLLRVVDDYQQRHAWIGFPVAVVKKYGDDRGGHHAARLAYYGFFSLFPLLLAPATTPNSGTPIPGRPVRPGSGGSGPAPPRRRPRRCRRAPAGRAAASRRPGG